ncbi:MAG: pyridoxal 5'-phosphate synthase glutaminase subunit PdxT [Eggerthellaceae bacterium]|jgi:5'-phosphate synthase pdxT subunit
MTTAVLALQGAFIEHERRLADLGERTIELRCAEDLAQPFDRLVLPGGESTVQGKLLGELGMLAPLRERIEAGMPVLGTCAGLILLARRIEGDGGWLQTLPVTVRRNAYGRQLGSFHAKGTFGAWDDVPFTFIRAPLIVEADDAVDVLARVRGDIIGVRFGNQIGMAFHPELDPDDRIHQLFLSL